MVKTLIFLFILGLPILCGYVVFKRKPVEFAPVTMASSEDIILDTSSYKTQKIGILFESDSRASFVKWIRESSYQVEEDIVFNVGNKRYSFTTDEFLDKLGIE